MNAIETLSRSEMKAIKGGSMPVDDGCHKCCWDHDKSNCSACAVGTACVTGASAVPCSPCNS